MENKYKRIMYLAGLINEEGVPVQQQAQPVQQQAQPAQPAQQQPRQVQPQGQNDPVEYIKRAAQGLEQVIKDIQAAGIFDNNKTVVPLTQVLQLLWSNTQGTFK